MRIRNFLLTAILLAAPCIVPLLNAADRAADWNAVTKALENQLPQDATAKLDAISTAALADNAPAEALKAQLLRIQVQASLEKYNEQAAYSIRAIEKLLTAPASKFPASLRPLIEAALAKQWWAYYQSNRWQLLQRTRTATTPSDDFQTWDAPRVLAETARHFEAALAAPDLLQKTSIDTFAPLIAEGILPKTYRPTLYDFLINEAIAFYSAGEQGITKNESAFTPTADSPLLGTLEEFRTWNPANTGLAGSTGSSGTGVSPVDGAAASAIPHSPDPTLRALQLYQQLLRYHQNDTRPQLALANADLARLNWAASTLGNTDTVSERHQNALKALIKQRAKTEPSIATAASLKLAQLLENTNPSAAIAAAEAAIENDPDSLNPNALAECHNLIARIQSPALPNITSESTWAPAPNTPPLITINYRNLTKVYFRAYPFDIKLVTKNSETLENVTSRELLKTQLKQPPLKTWTQTLPTTPDYRYRTETAPAPTGLKSGTYYIVASIDENFSEKENIVAYTTVSVSNLAILYDSVEYGTGKISGYIVNATTGDPLPNATLNAYYGNYNARKIRPVTATTNTEGAFSLGIRTKDDETKDNLRILQATTPEGQTVTLFSPTYSYNNRNDNNDDHTNTYAYFFTDRALYRPGQSIQFKVVLMTANPKQASYKLVTNRNFSIYIDDPNGKEAARVELTTNDYGSASGSFTIPTGRLTGIYTIQAENIGNSISVVHIEEYKRPKFEVTLPAPQTAAKLNTTVTLTGTATAYTGAPIDGAKVTWRVRRLVRWPLWCWWYFGNYSQPQEIAHGTGTTDGTGKFSIDFNATPDATADTKDEPIFNYTVTAEVTDTTGETRTATYTIPIGYTALAAKVTLATEWQTADTPITLKLSTTALDDTPQTATGTLAIHALTQPATVPQPELYTRSYRSYATPAQTKRPTPNKNSPDIRDWPINEKPTLTQNFTTDAKTGQAELTATLPAGIYRALVTTADRFGKTVTAQTEIRVLAPTAKTHPIKEPLSLAAPTWTVQPGETLTALWSSGYDKARAHISIEQDGQTLRTYWTDAGTTQQKIPIEITEAMRGGITLRITQVRDNRLTTQTRLINIPWENKKLHIAWEHFNSKLIPGGRETWTARITGPDATVAAAEFTAALYDASLDQYHPHGWLGTIAPFRAEQGYYNAWMLSSQNAYFQNAIYDLYPEQWTLKSGMFYPHWSLGTDANGDEIVELSSFSVAGERRKMASYAFAAAAPMTMAKADVSVMGGMKSADTTGALAQEAGKPAAAPPPATTPDLTAVTARKNLNETAFFYPKLLTDSDGTVRMEFTIPEALTRWNFLGFAHDKQLRSALLTDTAITAKDLMVQPNPPRFLRESDTVEFTVKVTNRTDKEQTGTAQLTFADAITLAPANLFAGSGATDVSPVQNFTLAPNSSQTLSWRITIPDGQGFITYKAVASTGTVSDGEEGYLPVLSRRQLVTESITLPIRDAGTRTFTFPKLAASATDTTLRNESLTVQMTSNPAWYAILALPQLMEFPHECSEQLFNRYYANTLAAHIANSNPKIARIFEQWRAKPTAPALESPLLKNEDLKTVLIEETPWLRTATRESEQRRAIGQLFDNNRTTAETNTILTTLANRQLPNGLWPWFPGDSGSEYITRYLVAGFARLRHFGIQLDGRADTMIKRALDALDAALAQRYAELVRQNHLTDNNLTQADVYQLYMRSFYTKENPIPDTARKAYDYFIEQTRNHWQQLPRQNQAHAAIVIHRIGLPGQAQLITTSLKQRAKNDPELGMYWNDTSTGWFWWQAPIETQALMIEAFDEVARDEQAVSDLQLWLLKQKQTQAWPSTKATADAIYALLLRGTDKLASDALVSVTLGDGTMAPKSSDMDVPPMASEHGRDARATQPTQPAEPGTGFYTQRIPGASVTPAMGEKITVTKTDAGPAWGNVTWQYLQTIDKITPHEGTPLTLKKTLWKQINTANGPTLVALDKTKLEPGDTLIVRIELRTDRDMEFVHLKDQRGSGTEPVNVISGYRWKNNLGYYESTRDTATHFFISRLGAGTYVFEYPIRVQLRGRYESGIAEIQCMYAPEYNSHSASTTLTVE